MKKSILIESISSIFILLFVYTAISKFLSYQVFEWDLRRDPLLENYSKIIAIGVPIVELLIAALLIIPKYRKAGLYSSFALMSIFTIYIAYVLQFKEEERHCTCGGFIRQMTWPQHLWFNSALVLIALTGIILYKKHQKQIYYYKTKNDLLQQSVM